MSVACFARGSSSPSWARPVPASRPSWTSSPNAPSLAPWTATCITAGALLRGAQSTVRCSPLPLVCCSPVATIEDPKDVTGYVLQDDVLIGTETVRETLLFAASMRLAPGVSRDEVEARVDSTLADLGISHIANSRIGCVRLCRVGAAPFLARPHTNGCACVVLADTRTRAAASVAANASACPSASSWCRVPACVSWMNPRQGWTAGPPPSSWTCCAKPPTR